MSSFGKFKVNLGTGELFREDKPVLLPRGEFRVLRALVTHPGESLSPDRLTKLAHDYHHDELSRSIEVQISRLRRKLEDNPAKPRYITTVYGRGYAFIPDDSNA